eukprot:4076386-Pyramimonas_sp.AAC.1
MHACQAEIQQRNIEERQRKQHTYHELISMRQKRKNAEGAAEEGAATHSGRRDAGSIPGEPALPISPSRGVPPTTRSIPGDA